MTTPSGYHQPPPAAEIPPSPEIVVPPRRRSAPVPASAATAGGTAVRRPIEQDAVLGGAEEVMQTVCRELSRLLASMPTTIARTQDLERALKVDNPLASRVWRLASATDAITAVELLPTVNQLKAVIKAAARAGAKATATERASSAIEALESYIDLHAGDMGQFEALVARAGGGKDGAAGAASESLKLKHRRAAFKTNSQVWELQARSFAACAIFHEADRSPQSEDVAFFRGYAKLQVLQPNHRLELRTSAHMDRQAGVLLPSLIEQHVDGPRPELVSRQIGDRVDTYMTFPALGKSNASTFYTRQLVQNSDSLSEPNPFWSTRTMIKVPCELLQLEVWVPAGWSDPTTAFAEAFACSSAPSRRSNRARPTGSTSTPLSRRSRTSPPTTPLRRRRSRNGPRWSRPS
ncbi:MAG: hypothetical protein QM783_18645 [Phycisphaerales bacterium]